MQPDDAHDVPGEDPRTIPGDACTLLAPFSEAYEGLDLPEPHTDSVCTLVGAAQILLDIAQELVTESVAGNTGATVTAGEQRLEGRRCLNVHIWWAYRYIDYDVADGVQAYEISRWGGVGMRMEPLSQFCQ
jgi:hypothetical protein